SALNDSEARFFGLIADVLPPARVAAPFALDRDDEAAPVLRVRVLGEPVVDALNDLVELAVWERPDQDYAGMLPACCWPAAGKRCEVAAVPVDGDPLVLGRELEDWPVVESFEIGLGGERPDVVSALAERVAAPPRREVRVEQDTHELPRCSLRLDERVELLPRFERPAVLRDRFLDLFRIL